MKAVSYCRVSTPKQARGSGLVRQAECNAEYAQANGIEIVGCYQDVISGVIVQRPALTEALAHIATAEVDYLLVETTERLGRSVDALKAIRDAIEMSGGLCFALRVSRNVILAGAPVGVGFGSVSVGW